MDFLNRRQFLSTTGLTLSSFALSQLFPFGKVFAADLASENHFFVMLNVHGGMDATLGLDPWIMPAGADAKDMFIEYRPDEILQAGNLRFAPAAASMAPFANRAA